MAVISNKTGEKRIAVHLHLYVTDPLEIHVKIVDTMSPQMHICISFYMKFCISCKFRISYILQRLVISRGLRISVRKIRVFFKCSWMPYIWWRWCSESAQTNTPWVGTWVCEQQIGFWHCYSVAISHNDPERKPEMAYVLKNKVKTFVSCWMAWATGPLWSPNESSMECA